MVNGAIPIIAMERNGLGRDWGAEARRADGPRTDHSKQTITYSDLVIHDLKKHMTYQFMNAYFIRVRYFIGQKIEIGRQIKYICIIRPRFFAGVCAEFEALTNR
jgi:hypothetical protein